MTALSTRHHLVGLLAVIGIVVVLSGWTFFGPVVPLDEGIVLVYPELIIHGLVPNRDFASLYTPGNYWFLAGVFSLFGTSVATERLVGLAYVVGLQYAIFTMARPIGLVAALMLVVAANILIQLFPAPVAAYAWFGGLALAVWSVVAVTRPGLETRWSLLVGGLLYGLAVLYRHDLSAALTLMAVLALGFNARRLALFALGALAGISPLLLHMVVVGTGPFFANLLWDVFRAAPGRKLPLHLGNPLIWGVIISCVTPGFVAAVLWFRGALRSDRLLLATSGLCLGILPQALQRADRWHLAYVGTVTVPLSLLALLKADRALGLGGWTWINERLRQSISVRVGLACMLLPLCAVTLMQLGRNAELAASCDGCVRNAGRVVRVATAPAELQMIVDAVASRSRPGQMLFIGPADLARTNYNDAYLYFLFPTLRPAAFYIEMAGGVSNRPDGHMADDLRRADFVILNNAYDSWNEENASRLRGSEAPLVVLHTQFCSTVRADPYELLQPCKVSR